MSLSPSLSSTWASSIVEPLDENWFHSHRHLTKHSFPLLIVVAVVILMFIGVAITQSLDEHVALGKTLKEVPDGCLSSPIQWLPYSLATLPLLLAVPSLIWLLRDVNDLYGIRREIIAAALCWLITLGSFTGWSYSIAHHISDSFTFPPSNILVINAIFMQLISICWPIWIGRKEEGRLAEVNRQGGQAIISTMGLNEERDVGLQTMLTPATFHDVLHDTVRFAKVNSKLNPIFY
jgi:hypothetical protein